MHVNTEHFVILKIWITMVLTRGGGQALVVKSTIIFNSHLPLRLLTNLLIFDGLAANLCGSIFWLLFSKILV